MQSHLPFKIEGKFILPKPFAYDNISINVSDSEFEAKDQVESVFGIEDEVQSYLDPNQVPAPNPRPKWAQKVIADVGNMTGESCHNRRTRYQFKNYIFTLFQENPPLPERCYKLPEICYMMVRSYQKFCSLKNNETLDHASIHPKRRDTSNFIHDKLEGKIYIKRHKGYIDSLLTFKLRNPLYGLKQGPRAWNPKFNYSILSKRF